MKKLGLLSFVVTALIGLSQPAQGGPSQTKEGYYFPADATYDSHGRVPTVRQVQLALEEDGCYVATTSGNFCFETWAAVRRYQQDKGLPITGKIDDALLKALRLR